MDFSLFPPLTLTSIDVIRYWHYNILFFPGLYFVSFLFSSPRWMPVVCLRRGWTPPRCLSVLPRHFPTHRSMPKHSSSKVRLYQPTMFWLAPASLTNTHASFSLFRLAPSTWSTGLSILPRTQWRCPGEQMACCYKWFQHLFLCVCRETTNRF